MTGFKSFADKIDIGFCDGITAIVGPNGCGKSNVADAIKWVLGEQSYKQLRGTSMQDVIFKGTEKRKQTSYCEVALVFDNRERIFAVEFDEVIISRKLFRDGESEYAVNRQPSRLKDINYLLHDSGIDRDGMTIISQGQVADLVNAKPENRRGIFEEAAGISKFRMRKDEAERKLLRTTAELQRVKDVITEIERNLGPLLRQAENAEKYLILRERLKKLEINLYIYKYDNGAMTKNKLQGEIDGYNGRIEKLKEELREIEDGNTENVERINDLDKKTSEFRDELLKKSVASEKEQGEKLLYLSNKDYLQQVELRREQLLAKRQMAEGFKYPIKRLMQERGEEIMGVVAREISVPKELETAIEVALGSGAQNVITRNEEDAKRLVNYLKSNNIGRATFLPVNSVRERVINFEERKILSGACIGVAADLVKYREEIKNVIMSLLGRVIICKDIDDAVDLARRLNFSLKIVTLDGDIIETKGSITGGSKSYSSNLLMDTEKIEEEIKGIEQEIETCMQKIKDFEAKRIKKIEDGSLESVQMELENINVIRTELNEKMKEEIKRRGDITQEIEELQVKFYYANNILSRVDIEIENLSQRILEEYNLNYSACYNERDKDFVPDGAVSEIAELRNQINRLGHINLDAIEQARIDKERFESYKLQVDDLSAASTDLEKMIEELDTAMRDDFLTAFDKINKNFGEVFKELFGGGRAEIMLTEPENLINSGVEIVAEPPGKRFSNLALLSGGEKALTAIAILFAILKLRAMPFCLLDEIEAALDDANVIRFANYLRKFSYETQFIVITHRKPTMELADTLYGVTMEERGISKIVSVKLEGYKT
jgi:chromosome segregation protein